MVEKNANGHVWLGKEALEKKLVHELGGFLNAIDSIRTLAGIPESESLTLDIKTPGSMRKFSLTARLFSFFKNQSNLEEIKPLVILVKPYLQALEAYRLQGSPQARLPFTIERRVRN